MDNTDSLPSLKTELLEYLKKLTPPEFEELITRYGVPRIYLSAAGAPQVTRATELLQYAENTQNLDKLAEILRPASPPQEAVIDKSPHFQREGMETDLPGPGAYRHCDRDDQDNDFRAAFEQFSRQDPGEPQFYLLHGEEGECHDSFVQRLCDTHLKIHAEQVFGAQRADIFTLAVKWSDREPKLAERDLKFNLGSALREAINKPLTAATLVDSLIELLRMRPDGMVVVSHNLAARYWKPFTPAVLKLYCQAYREAQAKENRLARCLVFFKLIYPPPAQRKTWPWWERWRYVPQRIEKQAADWQQTLASEGYLCEIIGRLTPVTRDEVRECVASLIQHEHERLQQLDAIFGTAAKVNMALVENVLYNLIEKMENKAL